MEFVDINATSTTPDILDISLRRVRISRGVFGFSGYFAVKEDIDTDVQLYGVTVYYSSNGQSYALSPLRIAPTPLTTVMNNEYNLYMREFVDECCNNTYQYKRFVSPMTVRNVTCENCQFSAKNYPTVLRPGYYKMVLYIFDKPNVTVVVLLKIEW